MTTRQRRGAVTHRRTAYPVSDRRACAFWILADPEGNEVCICTWQDRG